MNNVLKLVENEQTSEFFPTPEALINKMLNDVDWRYVSTVLEPSAGKGDILKEIAKRSATEYGDRNSALDVDCIELDANLRQILKYNFGAKAQELDTERSNIKKKYPYCENNFHCGWRYYNEETNSYDSLPESDEIKLNEIENELRCFFKSGLHIVHDDFLTYTPFKQYDLIVMNPPFSDGDKHLLKALEMQKRGGAVICLLNAETLKNPYTETRKELVRLLKQYNATVEYISNSFVSAERRTNVEIALIKVNIEKITEESEIYNRMKAAEEYNEEVFDSSYEIEVADFIKAMVSRFKVEVRSGIDLIRQYNALSPYMAKTFGEDNYGDTTLTLSVNGENANASSLTINNYLKLVRFKYWKLLMANPKFVGKLTSTLRKEYREMVNKLSDYDFTEFNIATISAEMNARVKRGIEEEIVVMYDRLTAEHTYYPEMKNNRHYYDGWCTNKAHKIDKKVIIPCYGVFDSWNGKPRTYEAANILEDIERILNYLDGGMTREIALRSSIQDNFNQGITKNIELKYFKATFYKKGTVHITFTCPDLIDRFNIYAAQNKGWLPPSYGKKTYKNMTPAEKAVIDSFQGEKAYNKVLAKRDYYLAPAVNGKLLTIGETCSEAC